MEKVKNGVVSLYQSIDPELLTAKLAYFTYLAGWGSIFPIYTLWMRSRGMTKSQTGVLMSSRPLISFIMLPITGLLADKFKIHKALLIGLTAAAAVLRMVLFAGKSDWLAWIFVFFVLAETLGTPVPSLLDAGVIELLGPARRGDYGKQRVWGSLSYGFFALAVGALVSYLAFGYGAYFVIHAVMMSLALIFFWQLKVTSVATPAPVWQSIGIVFSSVHIFVFFMLIMMIGAGQGVLGSYLFIMLDELNASKLCMGMATAIACLAEMPFLFFSAPLLRVLGERNMLYLACIAGVIRFTSYTYLRNPWLVLICEVLHGPYFGAMWSAAISYIHHIAPPGLGATAQGLLGGLYSGLGNGFGVLVGGIIYQHFGYVVLFRTCAVWILAALAMFFFTNMFSKPVSIETLAHSTTPDVIQKRLDDQVLELSVVSSDNEATLLSIASSASIQEDASSLQDSHDTIQVPLDGATKDQEDHVELEI